MNSRWQWMLAILAVGALAVGIAFLPEYRTKDLSRLEVVGEGEHFGYNCVVFRFHAPQSRNALIGASRMWVCSHGLAEAPPRLVAALPDPAHVAGGKFTEFAVSVPSSTNWWLEVETLEEEIDPHTELARALQALRGMTLRNSRQFVSHGRLRSEFITNAVPGFRPHYSLKWKPLIQRRTPNR